MSIWLDIPDWLAGAYYLSLTLFFTAIACFIGLMVIVALRIYCDPVIQYLNQWIDKQ